MSDFQWNDGNIWLLRKYWAEGMPTGRMGQILGCGKNAVIGKVRRLGLPHRPSPLPPKGYKAPPKQPPRAGAETLPPLQSVVQLRKKPVFDRGSPGRTNNPAGKNGAEQQQIDAVTPSRIATFQPRQRPSAACCWPTGDKKPWTPCDAPTAPGRPYCAEHVAKAYISRPLAPVEAA